MLFSVWLMSKGSKVLKEVLKTHFHVFLILLHFIWVDSANNCVFFLTGT